MLTQDNFPVTERKSSGVARAIISGVSALTLAGLILAASSTQLEWRIPTLDGNLVSIKAPVQVKNVVLQAKSPVTAKQHNAKRKTQVASVTASPQPSNPLASDTPETTQTIISSERFQRTPNAQRPIAVKKIKQPGNNIVVVQLPQDRRVPASSSGMPNFYKIVLKPKGHKTDFGLLLRTSRKNFGYDRQDIFTGEVPDGAYVIHCHRSTGNIIRSMCWRELQVSDDQWVQYRFPREQLKDWWKIEQRVRASIS